MIRLEPRIILGYSSSGMRLNTCASQRENDFMATMYILLSQMPVAVFFLFFFLCFFLGGGI